MSEPTVLITGASAGIGRSLAELFAADGYRLILVARSAERLRQAAEQLEQRHRVSTLVIPEDLSDPGAPDRLCALLQQKEQRVDALVNNAGFGDAGFFIHQDPDECVRMLQLNIVSLTRLTRLLLPAMIERGRGQVLQVGSLAGFLPGPYLSVYYASKAYVNSFTEALSVECRDYPGISICCVCPGPVRTGFAKRAGAEQTLLFRALPMDVETVARKAYAALKRRRPLAVIGLRNQLIAASLRFSPRLLIYKISALLNRPSPGSP